MKESATTQAWKDLRNALDSDDFPLAEKLLAETPPLIHERNGLGETVLHCLAVEDRSAAVAWLVSHGAEINVSNNYQPMIFEITGLSRWELLTWLLQHGADPAIKNSAGQGVGEYLLSINKTKQVRQTLAIFGGLGVARPTESEFLRECCLGVIREHVHSETCWEGTCLAKVHESVAGQVFLLPNELPIISFSAAGGDWTLYTTQRLIFAVAGKCTEYPAEIFSQLQFENLEEDHDSPRFVEAQVKYHQSKARFYYETGDAFAAVMGYFKFWDLWQS